MTDTVAHWLAVASSAHLRYRIAANDPRNPAAAARAVREALAALNAALALDPDRTDPAWRAGTDREQVTLSPRMRAYYQTYVAGADAAGR